MVLRSEPHSPSEGPQVLHPLLQQQTPCRCVLTHVSMYIYMCVYAHTDLQAHICLLTWGFNHGHMHVCMCIYIFIYIERDLDADIDKDEDKRPSVCKQPMHACKHVCICARMYELMHAGKHACMHI